MGNIGDLRICPKDRLHRTGLAPVFAMTDEVERIPFAGSIFKRHHNPRSKDNREKPNPILRSFRE